MTDTFTFSTSIHPQGRGTFRVRKAQFGDGYSQAVADGLNAEVQHWPLSFAGKSAAINPILAFLRAHPGNVSFYWTPPLGVQGFFRCEQYNLVPHGGDVYTLSAQFDQVFSP